MGTKWQRFRVDIPDEYNPSEREALGDIIIEFIRDRVQNDNTDKKNRALPGYSKGYLKSLEFKIAGKSKGDVNMTLSGDTLGAMTLLSHQKGSLMIGFENGSFENAKADGNIRGTFGKNKQVAPKRDFLGLTDGDLKRILDEFTPEDTLASSAAKGEVGE